MKYEIKIWYDPSQMLDIEPQKAANLLQSMANAARTAIGRGDNKTNPDILIDQNAGGEDAIQSVAISYITKEVDSSVPQPPPPPPAVPVPNPLAVVVASLKKKVRVIKIDIKGNLYLPLEEDGLTENAKKLLGVSKGYENKIRNTILLSKWASVLPENDAREHFYRGIVINIITKAGDFRVITAKKVYVDSYTENYDEGEFGTFTMSLIEKVDSNEDFKVDGLGYEKPSLLDKVKKGIATAGVVVAGVGAAGKTVTETVEKFTGETAATRWVKYGFDTAGSAGNIAKNPKDINTWNKEVNERIQKGVDTKEAIPLAKMESMYLSVLQKDPKKYEAYLKASDDEKYKMLEDASETLRDRAAITKEMEEETRDYYKKENAKDDTSTGAANLNTLISSAANKKNGDSNGSN